MVEQLKNLHHYIKQFISLKRAPGKVWTDLSKRKAPHKPILLLAILDMIHRREIGSSFIDINRDLIELTELFNLYWKRVVPLGQTSSVAFPFSRLDREPFWKLIAAPGITITPAIINNTASISLLREYFLGAQIDEKLFCLLKNEEVRAQLRQALLQSCFSEQAQQALEKQSLINREVYEYSKVLEDENHFPVVKKVLSETYRPIVRDQGFRRIVVKVYNHRCALCGVRIITPEQHTVVDAAHIVPWSRSHNDHISNGMALCKLCHWAFDRGMMGVSKDYDVILSQQMMFDPNAPGFLMTLSGRRIIPPDDTAMWPSLDNLRQHRREWGL